jgi:hypothetical protein
MTRVFGNLLILAVASILSLLAAEFVARTVLDPVDYLNPAVVNDEFLGHRIASHSGGHDAWGFRNKQVPKQADIVCIGDSATYGVSALAYESFPAALAKIRGRSVYNMALGGYGPIQYLHLMRTEAVKLKPKVVIVGFSFATDVLESYNVVRFNKNWSSYGGLGEAVEGGKFIHPDRPGKFLGGFRAWLSENSVLYAVASRHPIFNFIRKRETVTRMAGETFFTFRDQKHDTMLSFDRRGSGLDMTDVRLKAGFDIAKRALHDMRQEAEKNHMRFVVVLFPTKERAYGKLLEQAGVIGSHPQFAEVLRQEDSARNEMIGYLHGQKIEVVDLLAPLEAGLAEKDMFPTTDGHPNPEGYRLIAETIDRYLNENG